MTNIKIIKKTIALTVISFLTVYSSFAQGPTSPEAVGFEPVDVTDMVNLSNGNLTYVLPLLDVEGFPINLSYHAGISPNLEASWVGLGWYLNPGAINRATNGTPDDWKSGVGIHFTSYSETTTYYSITAGVGLFSNAVSVGVGAHWGGGQGLSGSIQANLLVANGYADTRGNLAASIGVGGLGASFSNNSKPSYSFGAGKKFGDNSRGSVGYSDGNISANYRNAKTSLGISFSGTGNFSVGGNISNGKGGLAGGSFSSSSSSDSQGDATIETKSTGLSLSIPVGPISINLGFQKKRVKISILKGFEDVKWGALYSSEYSSYANGNPRIDNLSLNKDGFTDYVDRNYLLDSYSTRLPQSEEEFIGDYSKQIENINFTFMAYDTYSVSSQGMMGSLTPRVFQNATIFDKGDVLENQDSKPIHAFWHHGDETNSVQRRLAPNSNQKPFEFYFDGQFTSNEKNDGNAFNGANSSPLTLNSFVNEGYHSGQAQGNNRAHQGNFVEVFTNQEIADGNAYSLITPKNIPNSSRDNPSLFDPNGIGGYKITASDGKTYHYSIPVYHYERVQRSQMEEQEYRDDYTNPFYPNNPLLNRIKYDCKNVNETRNYTRYATHWLLTAITGPDFVDQPDPNYNNSSGTFNKEDYGYWVELEYGKWSDGYVWRAPYQDFVYDYNTNVVGDIETQDKGHYQFGRKQVYYLDKINTRERTALFIKDIRYDGYGKELTYRFSNKNRAGNINVGNSGDNTNENSLRYTNPNIHVKEDNVNYKREYSLRLDKIVLIDAEKNSLISKSGNSNLGVQLPNYSPNDSDSPGWQSSHFKNHYHPNSTTYNYAIHQEQNVLDVGDIPMNFIQEEGIRTIKFNHTYDLVKNTPSSKIEVNNNYNTYGGNSEAGRLTLNSIEVLGRNYSSYMPPTEFTYYDVNGIENPNFLPINNQNQSAEAIKANLTQRRTFVDTWGYMQGNYTSQDGENRSRAEVWSLKEIKTPTGGTITVDYEEDDYWIEAFGRRYWENNLQFKFDNLTATEFDIIVKINSDETALIENFDFRDYFSANSPVMFDLWLAVWDRDALSSTDREIVNIIQQGLIPFQVTEEELVFRVQRSYITELDDVGDLFPHTFRKTSGNGSEHDPCPMNRGEWGNCNDGFNLVYKLLANKVPEDETGGGLRVKEIVTNDIAGNVYKSKFEYTHPTKLTYNNIPQSSGITSYAPVDGVKFIPYESEIPPPGVMYEYVTMSETDVNDNFNAKTRYRHHVLKPIFNIFNPNIEMNLTDSIGPEEDALFWASVDENSGNLDGSNSKKVQAKEIDININTALFGQIKSIELFNKEGQLLNKTEHQYSNGRLLNSGYIKETFNSLKTIFETNEEGTQIVDNNTKRLLSISSKSEYKNLLKKTTTIVGGQKSSVEFFDTDPWLGSFRKSKTTMSDGTIVTNTKVPAYSKYPQMGSKVNDTLNKNMLTQEAMSFTTITNGSMTLNANITTWDNDNWSYLNELGVSSTSSNEVPVWRKHKSFVWKEKLNGFGAYETNVTDTNDYFNWETGTPTNNKWQQVSEITRYTHWSSPIETRDINNNFASSKMADNFTKVTASGNARLSEMHYSGAEFIASGNVFEGGIEGANYRSNEKSHTGDYSLKITQSNSQFFKVSGTVGNSYDDYTKDFRPGTYKVSVWTDYPKYASVIKLIHNGTEISYTESVKAGNWYLLNYYVTLEENTLANLYLSNISDYNNSTLYFFDDFRMHPVSSSMNSFVYDKETDELTYILDTNNMASKYVYDDAGRLCKTYAEVVSPIVSEGGFKLVSENKYHYQSMPQDDCLGCCED